MAPTVYTLPEPLKSRDYPKIGSRWKSYNKDEQFTVIHIANLSTWSSGDDRPVTIVYKCSAGSVWTKTLGRFWAAMTEAAE
jgi:hypothetical protein